MADLGVPGFGVDRVPRWSGVGYRSSRTRTMAAGTKHGSMKWRTWHTSSFTVIVVHGGSDLSYPRWSGKILSLHSIGHDTKNLSVHVDLGGSGLHGHGNDMARGREHDGNVRGTRRQRHNTDRERITGTDGDVRHTGTKAPATGRRT